MPTLIVLAVAMAIDNCNQQGGWAAALELELGDPLGWENARILAEYAEQIARIEAVVGRPITADKLTAATALQTTWDEQRPRQAT